MIMLSLEFSCGKGVTFSEVLVEFPPGTLEPEEIVLIPKSITRLSYEHARLVVNAFLQYQFPAIVDYIGVCSLFENAMRRRENVNDTMKRIAVLWKIYQSQSVYVYLIILALK